jgi:outer membrane lipoprotein-sorting protein
MLDQNRKQNKPHRGQRGLGALLLIPFFLIAAAPRTPKPQRLLEQALNPPDLSFQGRMMVTYWFGRQTRAEELDVYHSPPGRTRREFLAPDGSPSRIVVSDGKKEEIRLIRQGRVIYGAATKSYKKLMGQDKERELLLKNYQLSATGPATVAGRSAWILELKPLVSGKPSQRLSIDQETGLILENKRFLPKKPFAALMRFTQLELKEGLNENLFAMTSSTAQPLPGQRPEPDFMSLEELKEATGHSLTDSGGGTSARYRLVDRSPRFPHELPGGFLFESADFFRVGKQTVRHARYTDGLAILSLFETDRPIRLPKAGGPDLGKTLGAGALRLSSSGRVLHWKRARRHYTLMGDLSRELLEVLSAQVK